jgi:hypothetical protein
MHTILGNRLRWITSTRITSNSIQNKQRLGNQPLPISLPSNRISSNPRLILPPTNLRMGIQYQWHNKRMGFKRPCINCGTLVEKGNRCQTHQSQYIAKLDERRKPNRTHYSGDYRRRSKQVRDNATICWICKQPFTDQKQITADHYWPGEKLSPLLPAHKSCNSRRGNNPPPQ